MLLGYVDVAVADYKNLMREDFIVVPNRREIEKKWVQEDAIDDYPPPEESDPCWQHLIQDQLREFHFFQNFTLKSLCQDYCAFKTCCEVCFQKSKNRSNATS